MSAELPARRKRRASGEGGHRVDGMFFAGPAAFCRALIVLFTAATLLLFPARGLATWSIAAVDGDSGEVGVAGASCAPGAWTIAALVPGRGVVVSQARTSPEAKKRGVALLRTGREREPQEVIAALTAPEFDPAFASRQYGVAALGSGGAARSYTGAETQDVKAARQCFEATAQGNALPSPAVVSASLRAFAEARQKEGLVLSDWLMAALEAGAAAGGDRRCGERRALSAFISVARPADPSGSPFLDLRSSSRSEGAVKLLRSTYDAWAQTARRATATVAGILEDPDRLSDVVLAGVLRAKRPPGSFLFNDGTGEVEVLVDYPPVGEAGSIPAALGGRGAKCLLSGQVGRSRGGGVYVRFMGLELFDGYAPDLLPAHGSRQKQRPFSFSYDPSPPRSTKVPRGTSSPSPKATEVILSAIGRTEVPGHHFGSTGYPACFHFDQPPSRA